MTESLEKYLVARRIARNVAFAVSLVLSACLLIWLIKDCKTIDAPPIIYLDGFAIILCLIFNIVLYRKATKKEEEVLYLRREGDTSLIFGGIVLLAAALIIVYAISFFCRYVSHDIMLYLASSQEAADRSTLNRYLAAGDGAMHNLGTQIQDIFTVTIDKESITVTSSIKKDEKNCEQIKTVFVALTDLEHGIREDAFRTKKYQELDRIVITLNGVTGQTELHAYVNREEICEPIIGELTREDNYEYEFDLE
jgi:hypothetical protein